MVKRVELSEEFQAYNRDFDLDRPQTQLSMLPDLIRIKNTTTDVATPEESY